MPAEAEPLRIPIDGAGSVSGLWRRPSKARACFVLAHGAGAGMAHPFLDAVSMEMGERGIATLRYQFPFMERGSKRPDQPNVAQAAVRAAVARAGMLAPDLLLVSGGRSFGGRMTSQAQAAAPLPGVQGLAFLGFPLHPARRPSRERGKHLFEVAVPMLFLQGTRDTLADLDHLRPLREELGERATLQVVPDADHSFHVPARSGRTDARVRAEILDALCAWIDDLSPG